MANYICLSTSIGTPTWQTRQLKFAQIAVRNFRSKGVQTQYFLWRHKLQKKATHDWYSATVNSLDFHCLEPSTNAHLTQHVCRPTRGRGSDKPSTLYLPLTDQEANVTELQTLGTAWQTWRIFFCIFNHQQWPTNTNLIWKVYPPVLHNSLWGSYFHFEWLRRIYRDEHISYCSGVDIVAMPTLSTLGALEIVLMTNSGGDGVVAALETSFYW